MLDFGGKPLTTLLLLLAANVPAFSVTIPDCSITMQIDPVETSPSCPGDLTSGQEYQIPTMECALEMIDRSNLLANESGKICILLAAGEHAITYSNRTIPSDLFISGSGRDAVFLTCSDEDGSSLQGYHEFPIYVSGQATFEIQGVSFRKCARPLLFNGTKNVTLKDCAFSGFTESAIEIYNTPFVTVANCSFTNNTSHGINPHRNSGNAGALSIGFNETFGPSDYQPQIVIQDSDFAGNLATDEKPCDREGDVAFVLQSKNYISRGGAIAGYFAATDVFTSVLVERCLFTDNKADDAGGAAYINFSGAEDAYTAITFRKCNVSGNTGSILSGGIQFTSQTVHPNLITIEDCVFENNRAGLGGAIKAAQFHTQGNSNQLRFIRTNFTGNTANVGAAVHIQSSFTNILSYKGTQTDNNRTTIDDCSFTENIGKDIVFISYNHLNFSGSNLFARNNGSSIRAEGSLLSFSGEVLFEGNSNNIQGASGALYLSSYGQLLLNDNTHISFMNNTGRDGAAIVVSLPLISITFAKTLYNSQCFLQFADHTVPPIDWINHNVSLEFRGNRAHIGPVLFITTLDACTWFNNSDEFFNPNISETWRFIRARENYVTSNGTMVDNPDQYIQTEVKAINITPLQPDTHCGEDIQADVCAYPGQDIQLKVVALDEAPFMHQTSAFLRIMPDTDKIEFSPPIVQTNILNDVIDVSYNSSDSESFNSTTIFLEASFSASRASRANFTVFHLECLPGFVLDEESRVCECAVGRRSEVLFCDPNMEFILLKNGRWGASPKWSRTLVTHICPPGYCNCTGSPNDNSTVGCALVYSNDTFSCKPEREGVLCGQCREGYGVGMLTLECRKFTAKFSMYYWLMPLLIIFIIVAVVVIVKAGIAIPSVLLGFLFYIQITAIAVAYIDEHFRLVPAVMDCFHSFFALYVPYNFTLHRGLTALEAYGLKFIPPILVLILAPIVMRIKYQSKSWRGVWTLVLLMYAMTVQTSASLLFCPTFTRNMNGTTESITVWFFDGSVTCYQGGHLALSIVAIIFLILAGLFIPVSIGIVCQKELGKKFTYFDRHHFEVIFKAFTDPYKEVHRWWVPFELIRRYVIIILLIFCPGYMTLSVSLIGGVLIVQWFIQPYKHWWTNLAEAFSVLVLTVVMFLGDTNSFVIHATGTKHFALFPLLYFPLVIAVVCFFALIGWETWNGARSCWRKRIIAKALAEKGRTRSSTLTTNIYKRMSTQTVSIDDCDDVQDGTSMLTMSASGTVS